jgi:hypothetical protein
MASKLSSKSIVLIALGLVVTVALYWSSTLAGRAAGMQATKPTKEFLNFAEFVRPPNDLASMMADSDLVALVQLTGAHTDELSLFGAGANQIATVYRGRLLETFRHNDVVSGQTLGDEITIVQVGGTVDYGSHFEKVRVADFSMLEPGQEYLLFLGWNNRIKMWQPSQFGPDGTFKLTDDKLQSEGRSALARAQTERSASEVLNVLRRGGL